MREGQNERHTTRRQKRRLMPQSEAQHGKSEPRNRRSKGPRRFLSFLFRTVAVILLTLACLLIIKPTGAPPKLVAEAAIAVDLETGRVLLEKNAYQRMYPASLTKLMTAILLSENKGPRDLLTYSACAQSQIPVTLDLRADSTISVADAMDALLVGSANDVAWAIAENISGTAAEFADLMNAKARELRLTSTHFANPSGLHDDEHWSCAADLAALFNEALRCPWIRRTMGKEAAVLSSVGMTVENTNPVLGLGGCVAGKTGYTSTAGKCLAALYQREGRKVVIVVLKSKTDDTLIKDISAVARWCFR